MNNSTFVGVVGSRTICWGPPEKSHPPVYQVRNLWRPFSPLSGKENLVVVDLCRYQWRTELAEVHPSRGGISVFKGPSKVPGGECGGWERSHAYCFLGAGSQWVSVFEVPGLILRQHLESTWRHKEHSKGNHIISMKDSTNVGVFPMWWKRHLH